MTTEYTARIRELEAEGMTTSDAQAVLDTEGMPEHEHKAPSVISSIALVTLPNGFVDGEATMTVAASTDEGHAALLHALNPAADWISHRSYAQQNGSYRVTFTYRPS